MRKGILWIELFIIVVVFFGSLWWNDEESWEEKVKFWFKVFIALNVFMLIIHWLWWGFKPDKTCSELCTFKNQEMNNACLKTCHEKWAKYFGVKDWEDGYYENREFIKRQEADDRYWRCRYQWDCDDYYKFDWWWGCNIKWNVSYDNWDKIYHVPWCSHYNDTVINSDYWERYFCSEQEAITAWWRKCVDY